MKKNILKPFKSFQHQLLLQIKKNTSLEKKKKDRNLWFLEQNLPIHEKEELFLQESNIKGKRAKHNGIRSSE